MRPAFLLALLVLAGLVAAAFYYTQAPDEAVSGARPIAPCRSRDAAGSGTVVLTFDDGWRSQLDALRFLEAHGYCATFFVLAGSLDGRFPAYTGRDDVARLSKAGHDIESHGMTHTPLPSLAPAAREEELVRSKAILAEITGRDPSHYAYPLGEYDDASQAAVERVYTSARAAWEVPPERYAVPAHCVEATESAEAINVKISAVAAQDGLLVLCFHQIDESGLRFAWTAERLKAMIDHLAASGAAVRTYAEAHALGLLPR